MTTTALAVITDAYERCNRLSPGETLSADDAAFGFRRLNILADEMSAQQLFLYKNILTSVTQTGDITLGAGNWTAIDSGAEIISGTAAAEPMLPYTMEQYNYIYDKTVAGIPSIYAYNGLSTVYLWPVPTAQVIVLQTRTGVAQFADQTTTYTVPPGYISALGAALAVRVAPNIIGKIPAELVREERRAMMAVQNYDPAILDVSSFNNSRGRSGYPGILYDGA